MRSNSPKPTNAELAILGVLWRRGPSTVRDVYEELSKEKEWVYTTVLKLMQIMAEKGLATRDQTDRAHVYKATQTQEAAQSSLVKDLVDRVFDGSTQTLVMHALNSKKASKADIEQIRKMLDEMEGKK